MKTLVINRFETGMDYTAGKFQLIDEKDNVLMTGFSLEPTGDDETRSGLDRRIPQGMYDVSWEFSPKFNGMYPTLYNDIVSISRRILIHAGNNGDDTFGCILVGRTYKDGYLYKSRDCLRELFELVDFKEFKVKVVNEDK